MPAHIRPELHSLARQFQKGTLAPAQLVRLVRSNPFSITPQLVGTIEQQLYQNPRRAHALAHVAYVCAVQTQDARQAAHMGLCVLRALNACTEFHQVGSQCAQIANALEGADDWDGVFQARWEGAWAATFLGDLAAAREMLGQMHSALARHCRTMHVSRQDKVLYRVRMDWLRARILRMQGKFRQAHKLYHACAERFQAAGHTFHALKCRAEAGHAATRFDPAAALPLLRQVRRSFQRMGYPMEVAWCDYFIAQASSSLGKHHHAHRLLFSSRALFRRKQMPFGVALCEMDLGYEFLHENRLKAAAQFLTRARDVFLASGSEAEASSCEINLGGVLFEQNHYEQAFAAFARAAELCEFRGLETKAALCRLNMAFTLDRQGRIALARPLYEQARAVFARERMYGRLALCGMNMGVNAFALGEPQAALDAFRRTRQMCRSKGLRNYLGKTELYAAQVLLSVGKRRLALGALKRARAIFQTENQRILLAFCHEGLAQCGTTRPFPERLQRLRQAKTAFVAQGLVMDAARVDLIRGELLLQQRKWNKAHAAFDHAATIFVPGFPVYAWRIAYGLGQIAQAQQKPRAALQHYQCAVQTLARVRLETALEQWSNNLFASHAQVYHAALALALTEKNTAFVLDTIEAAKAQTALRWLSTRDWHAPQAAADKSDALVEQERRLRYALAAQYAALTTGTIEETRSAFSYAQMATYRARHKRYEAVVTRLRNTWSGVTGMPELPPYSLRKFRQRANTRCGTQWAALDYYFDTNQLLVVYVDAQTVHVHVVPWTEQDAFVLGNCSSTHPDMRELVYNRTLHGRPIEPAVPSQLQHLASKLLPPEIVYKKNHTLLIAPHRALHQIPFAALPVGDTPLLEHATVVYAPSLQVLSQMLAPPPASQNGAGAVLFCGIGEFGGQAHPLPYARREIAACAKHVPGRTTTLWQAESTRATLLEWNHAGQLKQYGVLHFATHALTEPGAPHWSRILLSDEPLTVLDILDLKLNASLVVLSACSTAWSKGGDGDELVGLGRAFFYAGAHAVLATLWNVRDDVTASFISAFYHFRRRGNSNARALHAAQQQLYRNGHSPYDWAAFVLIGEG